MVHVLLRLAGWFSHGRSRRFPAADVAALDRVKHFLREARHGATDRALAGLEDLGAHAGRAMIQILKSSDARHYRQQIFLYLPEFYHYEEAMNLLERHLQQMPEGPEKAALNRAVRSRRAAGPLATDS